MPHRARVLPSSLWCPRFTSIIEKTRKRFSSVSVPLNESSRGGTDRPMYTRGAVPHGLADPASSRPPEPGIVSAHIRFDATPVVRLYDVLTRRFSNQA